MRSRMIGRVRTDEHRKNLSLALQGNIIPKEVRSKISKALIGKVESDETRRKKSLSWQGKTNNPLAHLTESDVADIRYRYNQNKEDRRYKMKLSMEYNVSWNTIHRIVTRQIWKHIIGV